MAPEFVIVDGNAERTLIPGTLHAKKDHKGARLRAILYTLMHHPIALLNTLFQLDQLPRLEEVPATDRDPLCALMDK